MLIPPSEFRSHTCSCVSSILPVSSIYETIMIISLIFMISSKFGSPSSGGYLFKSFKLNVPAISNGFVP